MASINLTICQRHAHTLCGLRRTARVYIYIRTRQPSCIRRPSKARVFPDRYRGVFAALGFFFSPGFFRLFFTASLSLSLGPMIDGNSGRRQRQFSEGKQKKTATATCTNRQNKTHAQEQKKNRFGYIITRRRTTAA